VKDRNSSDAPKAMVVRESRTHSPWPLVIVVAVPIATVLLRLPAWVTMIVLIVETVLLVFSPHLRQKQARDPKTAWLQLVAVFSRLRSAHAALRRSPADAAARIRYAKLEAECLSLLSSRADSGWGADSGYVARIRKEVADLSASVPDVDAAPEPAESPQAAQLEELKQQGVMSELEFRMVSDKLKTVASEKACAVLEAIAGFHLQCRQGTLTQADFHAALRGLLERLDQKDGTATPQPVTPATPGQGAAGG
jgi:hypothetical protein